MEAHRPKGNTPEKYDEAFDYYCSLGNTRSLRKVAKKYMVSEGAVRKWSAKYKWQERLKEINSKAQAKANKKAIDTLAEHKARCMRIITKALKDAEKRLATDGFGSIKVKSMNDIKILIEAGLLLRDSPTDILKHVDFKAIINEYGDTEIKEIMKKDNVHTTKISRSTETIN